MPDPLPQLYLSFHDITDDRICVLKNDQGERLTVTKEAVGDVAMMLAEFERDADKAEFVAEEWAGRADEIRWEEAELVDEESDELLDQSPGSLDEVDDNPHAIGADRYFPGESRIDLGGGTVDDD